MVDGVFYVKAKTTGKLLIGGQWVNPTGNRAFYLTGVPIQPWDWSQLWADMAAGGAGVADYLLSYGTAMWDSGHFSEMLTKLKTSGLSDARKQEIYGSTYASTVVGMTTPNGAGGTYRDGFEFCDYSGWDISNVNFQELMTNFWGDPISYGSWDGMWQGIDLSNLGFTAAQLSTANLSGITLRNQDLTGLVVSPGKSATLQLTDCNLTNADLRETTSDWTGTDLRGSDLTGANLSGVYLGNVYIGTSPYTGMSSSFVGTDMRGSSGYVTSDSSDFSGAKLYGSSIYICDGITGNWQLLDSINTPQADWNP